MQDLFLVRKDNESPIIKLMVNVDSCGRPTKLGDTQIRLALGSNIYSSRNVRTCLNDNLKQIIFESLF